MMRGVRQLLLLAVAWTAVAAALLLLWPSGVETPGCMHLVTPTADCLQQAADMSDRLWWTQTMPLLLLVASGYVVVVVLAVRRLRARRG